MWVLQSLSRDHNATFFRGFLMYTHVCGTTFCLKTCTFKSSVRFVELSADRSSLYHSSHVLKMVSSTPVTESPLTVGALKNNSWISNGGIIKLNLMLVLFQISSYATGYDGSMMNGLQSLTTWQTSFNNPGASELGL